jgi:NTE family protein
MCIPTRRLTEYLQVMSRALVLGGGGVAGIGWEAGLVTGLRKADVDLGEADLIVGTSAGSVVGAMIAQGADLEEAIAHTASRESNTALEVDMDRVMQAFMLMYDTSLDPVEARIRIGALALEVTGNGERLDEIAERLPSHDWPAKRLLVTAVDTADGSLKVWERDAPLPRAVASSCCVPCVFPPVEIDGRRYMDGGVRSISNADLAAGAEAVVIIEPLAHMTPRSVLERELATLGDARVATIGPDQASIDLFGVNVLDTGLWLPAFAAGVAQAAAVAEEIGAVWA